MTEPKELERLTDATHDPVEQALLREARDVRASDDTRRATLAALGLSQGAGGSSGSGSGPSGASSGASGGAGVAAKVALGAAFGLVVVGVVGWLAFGPSGSIERPSSPPAPPTQVATQVPTTTEPAPSGNPSALAPIASAAPATSAAQPLASNMPAASSGATTLKPLHPQALPSAANVGTFADEVRLIDQARKAVYDRDKEAALRALDEYDRRFPPSHPGQMAADAAALRVRARAL